MSKNSANNNMPYSSNDASDRYFGSNAPKIIERDEELRRFGGIKQLTIGLGVLAGLYVLGCILVYFLL